MHSSPSPDKAARTRHLHAIAKGALSRWGLHGAQSKVLATHHNAVFRIDHGDDRFVLRLARPGYQTDAAMRSELHFLAHVASCGVPVPRTVTGLDGNEVQYVEDPDRAEPVRATMFGWVPGRRGGRLGPSALRGLGRLLAGLHEASRAFDPPPWFERVQLDVHGIFGWGTGWREDKIRHELQPYEQLLARAYRHVEPAMDQIGYGSDRFGIIHCDLNQSNVLYRGHEAAALDFDDLALGHYALDIAIALHKVGRPGHAHAFAGYREIRPLPEGVDQIETFMMARRVQLMHWLAANVGAVEMPDATEAIARQANHVAEYLAAASPETSVSSGAGQLP